jgi:hypothetical protein
MWTQPPLPQNFQIYGAAFCLHMIMWWLLRTESDEVPKQFLRIMLLMQKLFILFHVLLFTRPLAQNVFQFSDTSHFASNIWMMNTEDIQVMAFNLVLGSVAWIVYQEARQALQKCSS